MGVTIPPLLLERIYSMYRQGYQITTIADTTGYSYEIVRNRIKKADIKRNIIIIQPRKPGKYDYLWNEPVCEGKNYKEYFKK